MDNVVDHTLGANCRLTPVPRSSGENGLPPLEPQFFYTSVIPIDDPLSTTSANAGGDARSGKAPLRPFSRGDNNTLEKAWMRLQSSDDGLDHRNAKNGRKQTSAAAKAGTEKRSLLIKALALNHWHQHGSRFTPRELALPTGPSSTPKTDYVCCSSLLTDVSDDLEHDFCALAREVIPELKIESIIHDVMAVLDRWRHVDMQPGNDDGTDEPKEQPAAQSGGNLPPRAIPNPERDVGDPKSNVETAREPVPIKTPVGSVGESGGRVRSGSQATSHSSRPQSSVGGASLPRNIDLDGGISGKPFIRVSSNGGRSRQASGAISHRDSPAPEEPRHGEHDHIRSPETERPGIDALKKVEELKSQKFGTDSIEVPVGVSRLHMVSLPRLQMKPIYWSPVNDVSVVMRATWFYRDTMTPVPPAVANQLEAGYHELRPWGETWRDEVRCAIEVGPLGEEKVAHRLWPQELPRSKGGDGYLQEQPEISSDPYCAARCFQGEAAAEGSIESVGSKIQSSLNGVRRPFSNYHVMFKDEREAFMLKPTLSPSAYYGRKPLSKIVKGITVGIPVVRGFDHAKWERLHLRKRPGTMPSEPGERHERQGDSCPACEAEDGRGQVTDLVLVAHGIGQKFAERVESFHFTHAINGFRRAITMDYGSPAVQYIVREGHSRLMVLPINWRAGLSFEDGGPLQEQDEEAQTADGFGLKDIEPSTIPAVRSMISDVMFDIPFYMSHHKGKMIKALVTEANRVYRLWCRNNEGFADHGRVHFIAHSLGSAMALDVLSRQPTTVPPPDMSQMTPESEFFEFDIKNLFLVGSPAGFFLLLERGSLMPRRGRRKPGADPADTVAADVVGEAGTFGCLAVDNIYNVLAKEDPIAYLLNGAVDVNYAASLKTAHVPSTATSLFKSVGDAFRQVIPGAAAPSAPNLMAPEDDRRPPTVRLPSQLELEVHDFTREEIAEKKAYLLNDNGQVDWYLRSGGGPLEIQYLNMLSAHTSYWTNHDFIRLVCVEIGRKPGKTNTVPAMRAAKATRRVGGK